MAEYLGEAEQGVVVGTRFGIEYSRASDGEGIRTGTVLLELDYGSASETGPLGVPRVHVPLPSLCGYDRERWIGEGSLSRTREGDFELAWCEPLLAGFAYAEGAAVERDTHALYRAMLRLVAQHECHLLRVWNVVPGLHERAEGLDRYMRFCRGRAEAFEAEWGARFASRLCAFSAVGSECGPQLLYFLACRHEGSPRENPRQIPAWSYPSRYGPRSPSFARGLRAPQALGSLVFVSGTASIVGHESRHAGDVQAQTRETLRNVRSLLHGEDDGSASLGSQAFAPIKVFLPRGEDLQPVQRILEECLGPAVPALYLQADICRRELLVEIEGLGRERTRLSEKEMG